MRLEALIVCVVSGEEAVIYMRMNEPVTEVRPLVHPPPSRYSSWT